MSSFVKRRTKVFLSFVALNILFLIFPALLLSHPLPAKSPVQVEDPKTPGKEGKVPKSVRSASDEEGGLWGVPFQAVLSGKYRARWNSEDNDHDLRQYLSLLLGEEQKEHSFHAFLRVSEDLDGDQRRTGYYAYDHLDDTYSRDFHGMLYYGYYQARSLLGSETIRLGRQVLYETPVPFHIDGGSVSSGVLEESVTLEGGAYGGIPVHLYESPNEDDHLFGAWARLRPWEGARFRSDIVRIRDSLPSSTEKDTLFSLRMQQRLGRHFSVDARHTFLDGDNRDLLARAFFTIPSEHFQVQFSWRRLFETQEERPTETDLFYTTLQEYHPYQQAHLVATKFFGKILMLAAGADVRRLENDSDESVYNREFRRYYLNPSVRGWPVPPLSFGVTVDHWDVIGEDTGDHRTYGFDIRYALSRSVRCSAGSSFAAYKYDYFQNSEREKVQTWHVGATVKINDTLKMDALFEYEDGEVDDFRRAQVGFRQTF